MPDPTPAPEAPVISPGENSGIVVGTTKTVSTDAKTATGTQDVSYQREFIKVYQDAGVVGLSFLTLLVLCVLLGMFCIRLLKMFQSLTSSRDVLETARTTTIEKLTTSILLLRQEFSTSVSEIRQEHSETNSRLDRVCDRLNDLRTTHR